MDGIYKLHQKILIYDFVGTLQQMRHCQGAARQSASFLQLAVAS